MTDPATRDPRLVDVPDEHLTALRELINAHGLPRGQKLAELTGLTRIELLGMLDRRVALPDTVARLRACLRKASNTPTHQA